MKIAHIKYGVISLLIAGTYLNTPLQAHEIRPNAKKKAVTMSCGDFVSLRETEKPKIIYWAEGLSHEGKTEDAYVDLGDTDRLVPIMVGACAKTPEISFWDKFKAALKKMT